MGFFFNYKNKNNARKFALKSFKMSVIIESEEEVEIEGQDSFYSWLLVQDVISGHKFIEVMYIKRGKNGLWGYKFTNELQGILQNDCPLEFLDDSNYCINPEWRKKVYQYHKDSHVIL